MTQTAAFQPLARAAEGAVVASDAALQPWLLAASVAMIALLIAAQRLVMRR